MSMSEKVGVWPPQAPRAGALWPPVAPRLAASPNGSAAGSKRVDRSMGRRSRLAGKCPISPNRARAPIGDALPCKAAPPPFPRAETPWIEGIAEIRDGRGSSRLVLRSSFHMEKAEDFFARSHPRICPRVPSPATAGHDEFLAHVTFARGAPDSAC